MKRAARLTRPSLKCAKQAECSKTLTNTVDARWHGWTVLIVRKDGSAFPTSFTGPSHMGVCGRSFHLTWTGACAVQRELRLHGFTTRLCRVWVTMRDSEEAR